MICFVGDENSDEDEDLVDNFEPLAVGGIDDLEKEKREKEKRNEI